MVYFSDIFNVDESILESYGAMNISLLNDIPLFIDPFLLYASEKPEYRQLHENILDYLSFLRDKASGFISSEKIKRWYTFPEVKQNWLGYSESGNGGLGLGKDFGQSMSKAIQGVFPIQKMLCCGILLMFSLLQRLKICWGTNWGRNFAGQKKKRANIESLFIPYRRFRFPKI